MASGKTLEMRKIKGPTKLLWLEDTHAYVTHDNGTFTVLNLSRDIKLSKRARRRGSRRAVEV